jgi:hypothetical protein
MMGIFRIGVTAAVAATIISGSAYAGGDIFVSGQAGAGVFTPAYGTVIELFTESNLPGKENPSTTDLRGQVSGSYTLDNGFGVQADILANSLAFDTAGGTYDKASTDGALHMYLRSSDQYLLGAFAQFGRDTYEYADALIYEFDRSYGGVEGQVYLDNLTLNAQLGLTGYSASAFDADGKGWFGTVEARYFLTPDLKLSANAGLFKVDFEDTPGQKLTNLVVGIGAEYKLADLPLSLTANLDYLHATTDLYDGKHKATRALVGLKFALGEDTLLDRDRKGTTLNPVWPSEYLYTPPQ